MWFCDGEAFCWGAPGAAANQLATAVWIHCKAYCRFWFLNVCGVTPLHDTTCMHPFPPTRMPLLDDNVPGFGGRGPPDKLQSIQQIAATGYAFAAVKVDHPPREFDRSPMSKRWFAVSQHLQPFCLMGKSSLGDSARMVGTAACLSFFMSCCLLDFCTPMLLASHDVYSGGCSPLVTP